MKLSPNEILILNVLQEFKKPLERTRLVHKTGISDKNISAKIKTLEEKGLIRTEKTQKGRSKIQTIQLTKAGKQEKLVKIVIEKKLPKKLKKVDVIAEYEKSKKQRIREKEEELSKLRQIPAREAPEVKQKIREKVKEITKIEREKVELTEEEYALAQLGKEPKKPIIVKPKPLPATMELKKELRLLINLVLTHRKEEYKKYGYKTVSEIRAEINTLIDQLGG